MAGWEPAGPTSAAVAAGRVADVSSLWTPGGEIPVGRDRPTTAGRPPADQGDHPDQPDRNDQVDQAELQALAQEMAEVRRQLAAVPAAVVVANHAMGLYELAAIHLLQDPPRFDEASLAIDAMGALVEGLEGRLGDAEPTLRDALAQLRLTFVQVKAAGGAGPVAG